MSEVRVPSVLLWMASLLVASVQACGGRVIYADQLVEDETDADETETGHETGLSGDGDGDADVGGDGDDSGGGTEVPDDGGEEVLHCSGGFAEPTVLFEDTGWSPQALSPTRDGLEFFYARIAMSTAVDASGERKITVRRRAQQSDAFGEPEPVAELDGVCAKVQSGTEVAGLDVSRDALRLYIACNSFAPGDYRLGPLLVARRLDRKSPFVVDPKLAGDVGYSVAISRDELTLFATSRDPSIDYVLMHTRRSVSDAFGPMEPVPGLPTIRNPEPVPGGLMLLGVDRSTTTKRSHLVSLVRSNEASDFSAPSTEGLPTPPDNAGDYSPALAGDCRSLYFLREEFGNKRSQVMQSLRTEP